MEGRLSGIGVTSDAILLDINLKIDKEGEDTNKEKSESKKNVKPLKLHKSKSADSWEIVPNPNNDSEIGIASAHVAKLQQTQMTFHLRVLSKRGLFNIDIVLDQKKVWTGWGVQNQSYTIRSVSKKK